jgi:AcrR family transcriptional regulator
MNYSLENQPTKERILDVAEGLFAQDGFEGTSLRAITTRAGVNLAAVNYHFQSKDALIRAVIARRIAPVNAKRLARLDAIEAAAGDGPPPIGPLIEAFVRPVIEIRSCAKEFAPIMGRVFSENAEFAERFFREHLSAVAQRFTAAFERAVPGLGREEVLWRAFFMIGSMALTLVLGDLLKLFSGGLCRPDDVDGNVKRMVTVFTTVFLTSHVEVCDGQKDTRSDRAVSAGGGTTA